MNGCNWGVLLVWDIPWFTSLSVSWDPYITGTLGGTARRMDFLDIPAKVLNASLFSSPILIVVLLVLDYVVHKLNSVWHEKLHLWKTYLAC